MRFKFSSSLVFILFLTASMPIIARLDPSILITHPDVARVISAIELRKIDCDAAEAVVRLGTRSGPSSSPLIADSQRKLSDCIVGPTAEERELLINGLKYLEKKPAARSALRAYFLAWGEFLRSLSPDLLPRRQALEIQIATSKKMNDALAELMLELSL